MNGFDIRYNNKLDIEEDEALLGSLCSGWRKVPADEALEAESLKVGEPVARALNQL